MELRIEGGRENNYEPSGIDILNWLKTGNAKKLTRLDFQFFTCLLIRVTAQTEENKLIRGHNFNVGY
jgi:hypothetical protein